MRRSSSRIALVLTAAAAALVAGCSDAPTASPDEEGAAARRAPAEQAPIYLVTFRDGVSDVEGAARDIARNRGFALRTLRSQAARGFSAVIPPGQIDAVRADPRVLIVERDGPVSLIEPIRDQARPGGGGGGGQSTPWGIARIGGSGDGTGKTAWIIDSGIDLDHPDLNTSRNCHVNYASGRSADDGNGHGTHVAGTIAAKDNGIDVVGVAANAYVCAVRVLGNSGSGTWEAVMSGIDFVARNGNSGDVANMSLGGSGSNTTLEKAVSDAAGRGIRFVLAAGNDGQDATSFTPARVNGSNIYTISAIDSRNCMPSWSNYGNPPVDYAAPGVSILSTRKGGGTTTMSGTSMAAPHVAGILLLGSVRGDGTACNDRDGNPDPIAHR